MQQVIHKRIMIIGCGGAGKSTLSRKLAAILNLPLHHLDKMFWLPGWVEKNRPLFYAEQEKIISDDEWIIDGNYMNSIPMRIQRADTVIYLNMPILLCFYGAVKRYFKKAKRDDIGEGCEEKLDKKFLWWILTFRFHTAPRINKILRQYKNISTIIELKSRKGVKIFLASLS